MEDYPGPTGAGETPGPHPDPVLPHADFAHTLKALTTRLNQCLRTGPRADYLRVIAELEQIKASCSAAQARFSYELDRRSTPAATAPPGTRPEDTERGTAAKIAIARRKTQHGARAFLRCSRYLAEDLPYLASRFEAGDLCENQVLAITSPLEILTPTQRRDFDQFYAQHPDLFTTLGCRAITDLVRQHTDRLHGQQRTEQIQDTTATRYLRFRRGPDCILLTGRLPLDEGLALQQHLERDASKAQHRGDRRTKPQLLCDLFIRRAVHAGAGRLPLRLALKLIITDRALFQADAEPAYLPGYGVIPAQYARRLIAGAKLRREQLHSQPAKDEAAWRIESFPEIQRLFTAPGNQDLIAMDSKARTFPEPLKDFIADRDRHCRTPHCDNPPTQADHVHQWWLGGATEIINSSYRCRTCNLAKETPSWAETLDRLLPHTMSIEPEPGLSYQSLPPPATGIVRDENPLIFPRTSWLTPSRPPDVA